jgi:hypothetical protein
MDHIKLFENFDKDPSKYLWPEAKFWLNKLEPEEISILALDSFLSQENKKPPFFEVDYQGNRENSPDDRDDEGTGSFEFYLVIPINNKEDGETVEAALLADISFSGGYSKFYPGNYYDPPEGGDYKLMDIEVENITYFDENNNEHRLLEIPYKSTFVTKEDIVNMITECCLDLINFDDYSSSINNYKLKSLQPLMDKCENIRKEDPKLLKGYGMINRFKR